MPRTNRKPPKQRVAKNAKFVHDDCPVDVLPQPEPIPCRKHPRYAVLRRPTGDCRECWAMWLAKLAREQGIRPDTDDPVAMLPQPAEAVCEVRDEVMEIAKRSLRNNAETWDKLKDANQAVCGPLLPPNYPNYPDPDYDSQPLEGEEEAGGSE